MITKFNNFNKFNKLYHGSRTPANFNNFNILFLSEDVEFSKDYTNRDGKYLYEVIIESNNVFNSLDKKQMKELFDRHNGKLYEPYNDKHITFDEYFNEGYTSDTWELIEYYIDEISHYDCAIITEGGSTNYVVFNPSIIISHKEILD